MIHTHRQSGRLLWLFVFILPALGFAAPESVIRRDDLILEACTKTVDGETTTWPEKEVLGALGLVPGKHEFPIAGRDREVTYTLAFARPVAVGSILAVDVKDLEVRLAASPDAWQGVPRQAHSRGLLYPAVFEPGTQLLGVRLHQTRRKYDPFGISYLRLSAERWFNWTPAAIANAKEFYTAHHQFSPPTVNEPARIVRGSGSWINVGLDTGKDVIASPPISDVQPTWFMLSWETLRQLHALYLESNVTALDLYQYVGPETIHPAAATQDEWRKLRGWELQPVAGQDEHALRLIQLDKPITVTGLKLVITQVNGANRASDQVAIIHALQAYGDLADKPLPEMTTATELPPFVIPYELPKAGITSMVVDAPDGTRVRQIFSRRNREAGANSAGWDLRDDAGTLVMPGTYHWQIVTGPPIVPTYEMTPYPNVRNFHPENTPWRNGHSGTGGWLSDHSQQNCLVAAGDRVYIGAPVCESGEALIEVDQTGKRLWGHGNFFAFTGPKMLAANSHTLFLGIPLKRLPYTSEWVETITSVSLDDKDVDTFLQVPSTHSRRRGMVGLAADDERLYVAINAQGDWLTNAMGAKDVDLEACTPLYGPQRESNQQFNPDPRNEFLRLLRLKGTPPGQRLALTRLESSSMPDQRQHIVVAFNRVVPIGSLVFPQPTGDFKVHFSLLKADAPYPPRPYEEGDWEIFYTAKEGGWSVIPAPPGATTRALRVTFDKTVDELDDMVGGFGEETKPWKAQLDGLKILRRRYRNHTPEAKLQVNSGTLQADGAWDAERDTPLTEQAPGVYLLQWKEARNLRGLAIKEIDGKRTEIDVYNGPAGDIAMAGDEHWEHVASYEQERRYFYQPDENRNIDAIYMDGYVDFGRSVETRAIRLRVVEQWTTREEGRAGLYGIRDDRGGMEKDPTRCRIYGVAALEYLGDELAVDPMISQRLEIYEATREAKKEPRLLKELPLTNAGRILLDPQGNLVGVVDGRIMHIPTDGGEPALITDDPIQPDGLAYDSKGNLYVFDRGGDRQNVRVYDAAGAYLRSIGEPGGIQVGPWNPRRIGQGPQTKVDIAIDSADQLWIAAFHDVPKRVSLWSTDGAFKREFLGNTRYGGGGVLNRWNRHQLFYAANHGTLEFGLNWETGTTELTHILYKGEDRGGELPVKIDDRLYLVTRPLFARQGAGLVYLYEKDHLRPVAGVGLATYFKALRTPEIEASLGTHTLSDMQFIWADTNGDGKPQPDELQFTPATITTLAWFDRQLGIQAGAARYQVERYLPNGAPVYTFIEEPTLPQEAGLRLDSGETVFFLDHEPTGKAAYDADGKRLWLDLHEGYGVHAISKASPFNPEQAVSEFDIIGFEPHPQLGEVFMTNSNIGRWNIWTHDGILFGEIMRDRRDPDLLSWTMTECERHMPMPGLTPGSEHFSGYFTRIQEDGKYYIVAGHNHISVLEAVGLDDYQRLQGTLTVSVDDIRRASEWQHQQSVAQVYERAPVLHVSPVDSPIRIDGDLEDWEKIPTSNENNVNFGITYDASTLYLSWHVRQKGPFKNSGEDWHTLFKTGASVDLQLQTRPDAPGNRRSPAIGDSRLLIAPYRGKPIAVLYQPNAEGAPKSEAWGTNTNVFKANFDRVVQLKEARIRHQAEEDGYILEAAIPLSALGLELKEGLRLKGDWGILTTSQQGVEVLQRLYWANQQTAILADEAAEAQIHPDLWGYFLFGPTTNKLGPTMGLDKKKEMTEEDVLDFLEE